TPQGTPEYQLLLLQYFTLLDGKGVEMMRDYANKQLIQMGVKKRISPRKRKAMTTLRMTLTSNVIAVRGPDIRPFFFAVAGYVIY
ncbi:hypothetical protein MJN76_33595, partial [Salmonella enterica subsp. enterica serovar Anatum]|nr:hypothetical protein [Salmonella enterica subsp. enterica serovar Anatum]